MKPSSSSWQHTEVVCKQCLMHCTINFQGEQPQVFVCNECAAVFQLTDESVSGEPIFSFRYYYEPRDS